MNEKFNTWWKSVEYDEPWINYEKCQAVLFFNAIFPIIKAAERKRCAAIAKVEAERHSFHGRTMAATACLDVAKTIEGGE